MPQYKYKARSQSGEVVEGHLESTNQAAAISQLKRDNLFPVSIEHTNLSKPARGGLLFRTLAVIAGMLMIVVPIIMFITKAESDLKSYQYPLSIFFGSLMFIYGAFGIDKSNWLTWIGERFGAIFFRH